jgi:predicted amidohydrolase
VQDLTISLIQTSLHWHDAEANRNRFEKLIAELESRGDIVVLPEMFTTGFTMEAPANAEKMHGTSLAWMSRVARAHGVILCGSLIIEQDGRFFNRLVWMLPDGRHQCYDKRHLFRMAGEDAHFAPGTHRLIVELNGWKICPLICYDLRFPVWSRGINEFDLMIFVANWPAARRSAWQMLLPARAIENQCYAVGVNRIGEDGNGIRYSGDSAVHDYLGTTIADCGNRDCTETVHLSGDALVRYREKFPAYLDADTFTIDD